MMRLMLGEDAVQELWSLWPGQKQLLGSHGLRLEEMQEWRRGSHSASAQENSFVEMLCAAACILGCQPRSCKKCLAVLVVGLAI